MTAKKRFLAMILALVLAFTMATPGFAAYDEDSGGAIAAYEPQSQEDVYDDEHEEYSEYEEEEEPALSSDLPLLEAQTTSPAALVFTAGNFPAAYTADVDDIDVVFYMSVVATEQATLFWYQDGNRREDIGSVTIEAHQFSTSIRAELALDTVWTTDSGVWTLRAYYDGFGFVESPYSLNLTVNPIGITPAQITTPLHLAAGAANSDSGPGWDWNGSTLELNGIDIAVTNGPAIQLPAGSNIILAAGTTNTIANTQTGGGNNAAGIQGLGSLSISGTGILEIDSGGVGLTLVVGAHLTVTDSTIDIVAGNVGISLGHTGTFSNAQLTINAGAAGISGNTLAIIGGNIDIIAVTNGMFVSPGGPTIGSGAHVTINAGGNGIATNTGNVNIESGAHIIIDAGGDGIQTVSGDVTISGDNTVINAPDGINAGGSIIVAGGIFPVMNSAALTNALAAIGTGTGTIRLGASFTHGSQITIPAGANITLTSENPSTIHTLTRGVTSHLITVQSGASLALADIIIDGNSTSFPSPAGRLVLVFGNFTMNNGTILQNNQGFGGGGVNVQPGGTFNMTGGIITNNSSDIAGGGVLLVASAAFIMTGGTISGNSAQDRGGGVNRSVGGTFILGGTATIANNTVGSNPDNASLADGQFITLSTTTPPTTGMNVGVNTQTASGVFVNSDTTAAHAAFFSADNPALFVEHSGGQLLLSLGAPTTGNGTAANPWQISTIAHWEWMRDNHNVAAGTGGMPVGAPAEVDRHYRLMNDLDLSSLGASAAVGGDAANFVFSFQGDFDGNNYTITVNITTTTISRVGLFRDLGTDGHIQNLTTAGTVAGTDWVGGLVGSNGFGTITNSHSTANVSGTSSDVGGLAGLNDGIITGSSAGGSVNGTTWGAGGLVGYNQHGTISNSFATGAVMGGNQVGGLVGINQGIILNSYAAGAVVGVDAVGGLVGSYGFFASSEILNSAALNPSVIATGTDVGRIVGEVSVAILSNNIAWSGMTGNFSATDYNTATERNGESMGRGQLRVAAATHPALAGMTNADFNAIPHLAQSALTITGVAATNRPYNSTNVVTLTGGSLTGTIDLGDIITFTTGTGTASSAAVGTHTVTASGFALGGAHAVGYTLAAQPTVGDVTISAAIVVPTITGPTVLSLVTGYTATYTQTFTVVGNPLPTVTIDNTHGGFITWNSAQNRLDIAAGLAAGTYVVVLTASNGMNPIPTHTFTLIVNTPPAIAGPATMQLPTGYTMTQSEVFTITGSPTPLVVIDNNHGGFILWNAAQNRLDIAAGLTAGTYVVVLTAGNGVSPSAVHTFTLTVHAPSVGGSGSSNDWTPSRIAAPRPAVTTVPQAQVTPEEVLPQFPFIDVLVTDWFYPYVRTVWENQLFQGTSHNMFTPQGSMTRAMFVQVLANVEGVDLAVYRANEPAFDDVSPAAWYFAAVEWAAEQGLVRGVGNDNFAPSRAITREEMAVMLNSYVVSRNIVLPQGTARAFTDQDNVSYWAVEGVLAIQGAGIILGRPDGRFAPSDTATRAEVATIFARLLEAADLPRRD